MKKTPFTMALLAVLLLGISACEESTKETKNQSEDSLKMHESMSERTKSENLRSDMRKLWEDHVVWTRNVIFCLVDNLPGKDQALKRLLQNQDDIGNAMKPYYGSDAGEKLTELLYEHITISADVVNAAKKDDKKALDLANEKWFVNADEISAFLSKANPNWKYEDLRKMMHDHLNLTTDEVLARIKMNYDKDIKSYDKVHDEILMMSDMLSDGIIKQYPDKFLK